MIINDFLALDSFIRKQNSKKNVCDVKEKDAWGNAEGAKPKSLASFDDLFVCLFRFEYFQMTEMIVFIVADWIHSGEVKIIPLKMIETCNEMKKSTFFSIANFTVDRKIRDDQILW